MKAAIWVTRSIEVAAVVVEPANAIAMRNATHATCSRRISTCRAGERRPVRDHDIVYEIDGARHPRRLPELAANPEARANSHVTAQLR
jgi:hypothetical protein